MRARISVLWLLLALVAVPASPAGGRATLPFPQEYTLTFTGESLDESPTRDSGARTYPDTHCYETWDALSSARNASWQGRARFALDDRRSHAGLRAWYRLQSGTLTERIQDPSYSTRTQLCPDAEYGTPFWTADCRYQPNEVTLSASLGSDQDDLIFIRRDPIMTVVATGQDQGVSVSMVCTGTFPRSDTIRWTAAGRRVQFSKPLSATDLDALPFALSGRADYQDGRAHVRESWTLTAEPCPSASGARAATAPPAAAGPEVCKDPEDVETWREFEAGWSKMAMEAGTQARILAHTLCPAPLVETVESQKRYDECVLRKRLEQEMYEKFAAHCWSEAERYRKMADDPPDARYERRTRVPAARAARPPVGLPAAIRRKLIRAYADAAEQTALRRAALTAFERAQGAAIRGDRNWTREQLAHTARLIDRAARLGLSSQQQHIAALRQALAAGPQPAAPTEALAAAIRERVQREGLPGVRAAFQEIGLPPNELAPINDALAATDMTMLQGSQPATLLPRALTAARRAARALRAYAAGLRRQAREA
jgi:hypothetical protein